MTMQRYQHTVGDTLTPISRQLQQRTDAGWVGVDLTGLTVKFFMQTEAGAVAIAETSTGVTVDNAEEGEVSYKFQTSHAAGLYYAWFRVYQDTARDTYPGGGRKFEIEMVDAA